MDEHVNAVDCAWRDACDDRRDLHCFRYNFRFIYNWTLMLPTFYSLLIQLRLHTTYSVEDYVQIFVVEDYVLLSFVKLK